MLANPRLLLSSFGVLARLRFVRLEVPGGLQLTSPSQIVMSSKADFHRRFPTYRMWVIHQLEATWPDSKMKGASIAELEERMSEAIFIAVSTSGTGTIPR